jgi:acyl-CoA oxidase
MNPTFSPGVLSMLPIFYVGWKDSILSTSEMKLIHTKIGQMSHLTREDIKYLIDHTNPEFPPGQELYKQWLDAIHLHAKDLSSSQCADLVSLGIAMAKITFSGENTHDHRATVDAISDIATAMGIGDPVLYQGLMNQLGVSGREAPVTSYSFDPQRLYDELHFFRKEAVEHTNSILADPIFRIDEAVIDKDELRTLTLTRLQELARQGLGIYAYPMSVGGSNDMGSYMAAFETLAYHDLSLGVKFGVQFGLFGGAILALGATAHHQAYLHETGYGRLLGCFAMTETGHGSNVKDIKTTATYDHLSRRLVVHSPDWQAGKEYIGNALHSTIAVVFAQLIVGNENHGVHAIVVPLRDTNHQLLQGIKVEDCGTKMGLNGVDNGRIWFDQVEVPKANLLNKYGDIDDDGQYSSPIVNANKRFFVMLSTLVGGRICVGTGALSAAKTSLAIAIEYALRRRQFAPKDGEEETLIMDYPTHQHRLMPRLAKTIVFHHALYRLAEQYTSSPNEEALRKIETKAAGLKALATWHATDTIQACREACGGKGYLAENVISRMKADADIFTTFEGDNTVLLQLVAKGLLTEFNDHFHEERWAATWQYFGDRINFSLAELNPYFSRLSSVEHLESDEFIGGTLRYREKKMLVSLVNRMRSLIGKQLSPQEAFIKCQVHMIETARAYIERLAYRVMAESFKTMADTPEKDIIMRIHRLYGLGLITEHKSWYLENDYFGGIKSKALRRVYEHNIASFRKDIGGIALALGVNTEVYKVKK